MTATPAKPQFRTGPLFAWNMSSQARVKVNQGGSSSGKTMAILQVIFMLLADTPGLTATIVGQDIPNLKKGAIRDFQKRILGENPWMRSYLAANPYNKTERTYTFLNGSEMEFTSFKDGQDAKSGKRDIAFFNEADGISYEIYQQVAMRTTTHIFLDYNPTSEFWVHDHLIGRPNVQTFYSNFRHNPYIPKDIRDYLLSLKQIDAELWKVYGLGKTGTVHELAIPKITIVDEMPKALRCQSYGLDFGYRADPSCLVHGGVMNGSDLYLDEQFYRYKMTQDDIDQAMRDLHIRRNWHIFADSSDTRVIDYLQKKRWNIWPVEKGPGSVAYGLSLLNSYNVHVTVGSINGIMEQKRYKHKIDPKTGRILNDVVKAWDHFWDAARYYAIENLTPIGTQLGVMSG